MPSSPALETFISDLEAADVESAPKFMELLNRGFDLLALTDKDITNAFGASRPTILRWRKGVTAPYSLSRKAVYKWLAQRARTLASR